MSSNTSSKPCVCFYCHFSPLGHPICHLLITTRLPPHLSPWDFPFAIILPIPIYSVMLIDSSIFLFHKLLSLFWCSISSSSFLRKKTRKALEKIIMPYFWHFISCRETTIIITFLLSFHSIHSFPREMG